MQDYGCRRLWRGDAFCTFLQNPARAAIRSKGFNGPFLRRKVVRRRAGTGLVNSRRALAADAECNGKHFDDSATRPSVLPDPSAFIVPYARKTRSCVLNQ